MYRAAGVPPPMSTVPRVLLSLDEAARFASEQRRHGRRIAFVGGAFDLLHRGHLRSLQAAREAAEVLIVGVRSDRSVRASAGPGRPVIPEWERAEVLAALACVDGVLVCDEGVEERVIGALQPDVLACGTGEAADRIVGREIVEARGGRLLRTPLEAGYSTSELIRRARALPGRKEG